MAELSGLEVLALLKEIDSALHGTYINNIYSIGSSQLIRLRKQEAADVWLVVSPKKGVWVSGNVAERAETTGFTSRLRGELERARFAGAFQIGLDRIFELTFDGRAKRKLVVELMPPGNIVLVDEAGRVVIALEEVRAKTRRVVRGEMYLPPGQSRLSPTGVRADDVRSMLAQEKTAGRALGRHVALPRKYVSESLARLGVTDETPSSALSGREEDVVGVLGGLVKEARDNPRPCICRLPEGEEVFVVQPVGAEVVAAAGSVSELCDRLFLPATGTEERPRSPEQEKQRELEATITKLKAESASLHVEAAKVRAAAALAGSASVEEGLKSLKDSGVRLLQQPKSPSAVASLLFDRAKVLEQKSADSTEAAGKLEKKLGKIRPAETSRMKPLPRRRQEWFERFRWFTTSGGRLAVGGRDAQSNTLLVRRHLEDPDVIYHADLFGSPFFIVKDGLSQTELEVQELAQATVSFSSGWKTGLGAADAYWVNKDQVSGTPESGEYLAKGSFVIRGKKNFVKHVPLQVAVGLDGAGRVIAGPESAVAKSCSGYVVLTPHREKPTDTAKKILKELVPTGAAGPSLDEVVRALPSGGGKVVRKKTGTSPRE